MPRISQVSLCLAALSLALIGSAYGQGDCGSDPGPVRFSENFYLAQRVIARSIRSSDLGVSLGVDGIELGVTGSTEMDEQREKDTTLQTAREYVRQEYQNQRASIIAECGYRICKVLQSTNTENVGLGLTVLGDVCGTAPLQIGAFDPTQNRPEIVVQPKVTTLVFGHDVMERRLHVQVKNNSGNDAEFAWTLEGAKVRDSSKGTLKIRSQQTGEVVPTILRPDGVSQSRTATLRIQNKNAPNTVQVVQLTLVPDPLLAFPAPAANCGRLTPNVRSMHAKKGYGDYYHDEHYQKPFDFPVAEPVAGISTTRIPSGNGVQGPSDGDENGTYAKVRVPYFAECRVPQLTPDQARMEFGMRVEIEATCGLAGASAAGGAGPVWESTFFLPGTSTLNAWELKYKAPLSFRTNASQVELNPQCSLKSGTTLSRALDPIALTEGTASFAPGWHVVQFKCEPAANPYRGCAGAPTGTVSRDTYTFDLAFDFQRKPLPRVIPAAEPGQTPAEAPPQSPASRWWIVGGTIVIAGTILWLLRGRKGRRR